MADSQIKLLSQIITRIGLIDNEQLLQKSTELLRLLELKSNGIVQSLGDYAKATICIDLASGIIGVPFDMEIGLKMSGLKKSGYNTNKRTFEKLLDLNKIIGINEICVQLGLSQVQNEAQMLLNAYKAYTGSTNNEIDLSHPQYAAMAVFLACARKKVKVAKSKLIPISHLKLNQWTLLEKSWENWMKTANLNSAASTEATIEKKIDEIERNPVTKKIIETKTDYEDYESWKKRMLAKAYKELETNSKQL